MRAKRYAERAVRYANEVVDGNILVSEEAVSVCKRFLADLERDDLELRTAQPDAVCSIIEGLLVHRKGEALDGTPLIGKPLPLEDWKVFVVYNLLGFWKTGTEERRYKVESKSLEEALASLGI